MGAICVGAGAASPYGFVGVATTEADVDSASGETEAGM